MRKMGTGWAGTGSIVGIEPVPRTRTGLQRGYMTCPWDRGQVSFDLSLSHWDRFGIGSVPVPCACTTLYMRSPCTKWYRHSACTTLWKSSLLARFRDFPYPKTEGGLIEFRNSKGVLIKFREKNQRGPIRISYIKGPNGISEKNQKCSI